MFVLESKENFFCFLLLFPRGKVVEEGGSTAITNKYCGVSHVNKDLFKGGRLELGYYIGNHLYVASLDLEWQLFLQVFDLPSKGLCALNQL